MCASTHIESQMVLRSIRDSSGFDHDKISEGVHSSQRQFDTARCEKFLVIHFLIFLQRFSRELYSQFETMVGLYHLKEDCNPPTWTNSCKISMNLVDR